MRRTAATVAMAAAATSLTAAAGSPAHAAASSVSVSPNPVVLTAKSSTWVTVRIRIPGLPANSWVNVDLRGPKGDWTGEILIEDPNADGVFEAALQFDRYREPGTWRAETESYNYNTGVTLPGPTTSFSVRANTKLTADAGPEPARKGRTLTVSGKLTRLEKYGWDGDYLPYSGQRIRVLFKKKGTSKWVPMGYATTTRTGRFTKRFTAKATGIWRATYAGNTTYQATTTTDQVKVRR